MKTVDFVRLSSALCLTAIPATIAGAQGLSDPAPIVSAFNETCRRGFPDLETVRRHAESTGWIRRSVELIAARSNPKLRNVVLPDFLQKGDMTLVVSTPSKLYDKTSCTVAATAEKTLDTRGLAEAVSAALDGAPASFAKLRGVEQATWNVKPGLVVKASVSKSGRVRTANVAVQIG
ncbi:MAG TPA: hypothetical protein VF535_09365 [Allosphingosinicella sp.]|jgi:hypothetical protein